MVLDFTELSRWTDIYSSSLFSNDIDRSNHLNNNGRNNYDNSAPRTVLAQLGHKNRPSSARKASDSNSKHRNSKCGKNLKSRSTNGDFAASHTDISCMANEEASLHIWNNEHLRKTGESQTNILQTTKDSENLNTIQRCNSVPEEIREGLSKDIEMKNNAASKKTGDFNKIKKFPKILVTQSTSGEETEENSDDDKAEEKSKNFGLRRFSLRMPSLHRDNTSSKPELGANSASLNSVSTTRHNLRAAALLVLVALFHNQRHTAQALPTVEKSTVQVFRDIPETVLEQLLTKASSSSSGYHDDSGNSRRGIFHSITTSSSSGENSWEESSSGKNRANNHRRNHENDGDGLLSKYFFQFLDDSILNADDNDFVRIIDIGNGDKKYEIRRIKNEEFNGQAKNSRGRKDSDSYQRYNGKFNHHINHNHHDKNRNGRHPNRRSTGETSPTSEKPTSKSPTIVAVYRRREKIVSYVDDDDENHHNHRQYHNRPSINYYQNSERYDSGENDGAYFDNDYQNDDSQLNEYDTYSDEHNSETADVASLDDDDDEDDLEDEIGDDYVQNDDNVIAGDENDSENISHYENENIERDDDSTENNHNAESSSGYASMLEKETDGKVDDHSQRQAVPHAWILNNIDVISQCVINICTAEAQTGQNSKIPETRDDDALKTGNIFSENNLENGIHQSFSEDNSVTNGLIHRTFKQTDKESNDVGASDVQYQETPEVTKEAALFRKRRSAEKDMNRTLNHILKVDRKINDKNAYESGVLAINSDNSIITENSNKIELEHFTCRSHPERFRHILTQCLQRHLF